MTKCIDCGKIFSDSTVLIGLCRVCSDKDVLWISVKDAVFLAVFPDMLNDLDPAQNIMDVIADAWWIVDQVLRGREEWKK